MCAFMCRLTAIVHGWHTDAGERTKKKTKIASNTNTIAVKLSRNIDHRHYGIACLVEQLN